MLTLCQVSLTEPSVPHYAAIPELHCVNIPISSFTIVFKKMNLINKSVCIGYYMAWLAVPFFQAFRYHNIMILKLGQLITFQ